MANIKGGVTAGTVHVSIENPLEGGEKHSEDPILYAKME